MAPQIPTFFERGYHASGFKCAEAAPEAHGPGDVVFLSRDLLSWTVCRASQERERAVQCAHCEIVKLILVFLPFGRWIDPTPAVVRSAGKKVSIA